MPPLTDIINDLPPELAAPAEGDDDTNLPAGDDPTPPDDNTPAAGDDDDDQGGDAGAARAEDDDDNDDYITDLDDDEPITPAAATPPAAVPPQATTEDQYILSNLQKISVRVVMPGEKDGEQVIKQVDVYGAGDLPKDMLGFATAYEQTLFNQSLNAQETKARELQSEFRNNKIRSDTESFVQRENKMIADDLTDLRREGTFPKFKGVPGTKEFNDSDGAKEFDKVIAYMNQQNDAYAKAANTGKAYRHIGFREAYTMLNGPNPKAAQQADMKGRRAAAARTKGGNGTPAGERQVNTQPVNNINDLAGEFAQFAGGGSGAAT